MKITQTRIPEVSAEQLMQGEFLEKQIRIHGSIYKIRKMSGFAFVLLRTKREIIQCVYGEFSNFALSELSEESCVIFTADVVKEERSKTGFDLYRMYSPQGGYSRWPWSWRRCSDTPRS